ncbi:hypothetical protein AAE478_010253 [Parahypoxylon ruwenzoriense]
MFLDIFNCLLSLFRRRHRVNVASTDHMLLKSLEEKEEALAIANDHIREHQKKIGELKKTIEDMREERKELRGRIMERESHIFSLQPYHRELTVHDAEKEYSNLISGVSEWVNRWTDLIINDDESLNRSFSYAEKNHKTISEFPRFLNKWTDISGAIGVRDIDQQVLGNAVDVLSGIESAMNENMDPKPDLFAIRSWRAQAYLAMVAHPNVKELRKNAAQLQSERLARALGFISCDNNRRGFLESISLQLVEPAISLHEKFLTSINEFRLDMAPIPAGKKYNGSESQLNNLNCIDIASNDRKLTMEKLQPKPSTADIRKNLYVICSICPALTVIEAGRGRFLKEPAIVYKERLLVAWIDKEDKRETVFGRGSTREYWLQGVISKLPVHAESSYLTEKPILIPR